MGIVGDIRSIRHCACKYGQGVDDSVFLVKIRSGEVVVLELDGLGELLTLGILRDYQEGVVVLESGANAKTVAAAEISGEPCARFLCMMTWHPSGPMGVAL